MGIGFVLHGVDWKWAVTALIAIYGAALATYTSYKNNRDNKRQIAVKLSHGFLTFGPNLSGDMLILEASNPGHRPVTLSGVGLLLPDDRQMVLPDMPGTSALPHQLNEGTSMTHWMAVRETTAELRRVGFSGSVRLTAFYRDATGKVYKSKPFAIQV